MREPLAVAAPNAGPEVAAVYPGESGLKQLSQWRTRSAFSRVKSVTSSTLEQKQVGQTSVQLVQDRQRSATSSQRGMLLVAVQEVANVRHVQRPAHRPRA